jgi:type 1 glutamine amidotransferase
MKKITIVLLASFLVCFSCIKKKALKYDPDLVGTWVSNSDSVNTWLIITSDGQGIYSTHGNNEDDAKGEVKYSLFENKMWIGEKKFKVVEWLTGITDGVSSVKTKEYTTLKDTTYYIDMKMILKTTTLFKKRSITFYRLYQ